VQLLNAEATAETEWLAQCDAFQILMRDAFSGLFLQQEKCLRAKTMDALSIFHVDQSAAVSSPVSPTACALDPEQIVIRKTLAMSVLKFRVVCGVVWCGVVCVCVCVCIFVRIDVCDVRAYSPPCVCALYIIIFLCITTHTHTHTHTLSLSLSSYKRQLPTFCQLVRANLESSFVQPLISSIPLLLNQHFSMYNDEQLREIVNKGELWIFWLCQFVCVPTRHGVVLTCVCMCACGCNLFSPRI
jgi:hypothetical protein